MKKKLIIVEGMRGAGKTTITNWLREVLPYTTLLRLSGVAEKGEAGRAKVSKTRMADIIYCKTLEGCGTNIVMDRSFITEYVYSNFLDYTGYCFKDYFGKFCSQINDLKDYDLYLINLCVSDKRTLEQRLSRDKADFRDLTYSVEESFKQMDAYSNAIGEFKIKCSNFKVLDIDTSMGELAVRTFIQENVLDR